MKFKVKFYRTRIVRDWMWQFTIIPCLTICRNKQMFIATGEYGEAWILSFSFMFWDIGIMLYTE
jgi:hypothetical protein